ncbi:MAG: hypothetical protein QOH12_3755 [Solirubrobacteraceae bacterium]|nr:hypothetical protein [Solirubrobacteraceae bacterium]
MPDRALRHPSAPRVTPARVVGDGLHRCASCDRHARGPSASGTRCEFCGGGLHPVWGLGQLVPHRGDLRVVPARGGTNVSR